MLRAFDQQSQHVSLTSRLNVGIVLWLPTVLLAALALTAGASPSFVLPVSFSASLILTLFLLRRKRVQLVREPTQGASDLSISVVPGPNVSNEPSALTMVTMCADSDASALLESIARTLQFNVFQIPDRSGLVAKLQDCEAELLITDRRGLEFMHDIRQDPELSALYTILFVDQVSIELKVAALSVGYDDIITTSDDANALFAKLVRARRLIWRSYDLGMATRYGRGMATRDAVTGLFSHRYFREELERSLTLGSVGIAFFDIQDFRAVNDRCGHAVGDNILRDIGSLFLAITRDSDLPARYGGDEFVVLVRAVTAQGLDAFADNIRAQVAGLRWHIRGAEISVRLRSGVAIGEGLSAEELLNKAANSMSSSTERLQENSKAEGHTPVNDYEVGRE